MGDDTGLSPQSNDDTEAGFTAGAYVGPMAWSDATSSQPVVEYIEPRWRSLLPKLFAPAVAGAIGAVAAVALMLWIPERHLAPAPSPTPSVAAPSTTAQAAPVPVNPQAAPRPPPPPATPPSPRAAPNSRFCQYPSQCIFHSPSLNISCEIDNHFFNAPDEVFCYSINPPQSATLDTSGALTHCTGSSCLANAPQWEQTLDYGEALTLGPFICLSETIGVTCSVASGHGFSISNSGITPVW